MFLAKVTGNVVSTKKDEALVGCKLLILRKIDENESFIGDPIVAVDTVGAGAGEMVLVITGSGARITDSGKTGPIDAAIVGIVDYVEINH